MGSKEAEAPRLYNRYEQTYTPKPLLFQVFKKKLIFTGHVSCISPRRTRIFISFLFQRLCQSYLSPVFVTLCVCGLVSMSVVSSWAKPIELAANANVLSHKAVRT